MSQHQKRAKNRAHHKNPKNVSIIVNGIHYVIDWKTYQEYLKTGEYPKKIIKEEVNA